MHQTPRLRSTSLRMQEDKEFYAKLGQRVAGARKKAGLTQAALSEKLGIGKQTIAHYESGHLRTPIWHLRGIAEVLELPGEVVEPSAARPGDHCGVARAPSALSDRGLCRCCYSQGQRVVIGCRSSRRQCPARRGPGKDWQTPREFGGSASPCVLRGRGVRCSTALGTTTSGEVPSQIFRLGANRGGS